MEDKWFTIVISLLSGVGGLILGVRSQNTNDFDKITAQWKAMYDRQQAELKELKEQINELERKLENELIENEELKKENEELKEFVRTLKREREADRENKH